ncbi:discoidin domain-containing protein [Actinomadura sp. KC06]|uniref:discoidin domain-containing protein n=1 Tax=Actinomadura sp. KC06 TaxID=2530369 RepID=UPI0010505770|nr:discoidin domain-containing protein [Actinomadura sp. KC06]TDD36491.1 discoidin domain-containing protein [Actinomadura sp. KC06]
MNMAKNFIGRLGSAPTLATAATLMVGTLLAGLLAAGAFGRPGPALAAPAERPADLLVVQANLQDAMRPADAADTADLDHFASRVVKGAPRAPDVLLLTDILGPGAVHLAKQLSRSTRDSYRVAVSPGRTPFLDDGGVRASAILINTDTLSGRGAAGFVRVQGEDQAQLTVVGRGSSQETHLMSGRVGAVGAPIAQAAATEFATALRKRAGDTEMAVLGADFSSIRCAQAQKFGCALAPFWSYLTQTSAYDEAAFVGDSRVSTRQYTNFLFARGRVAESAMDVEYDNAVPNPATCKAAYDRGDSRKAGPACGNYYADQPFTWARLQPDAAARRTVFPARINLDQCEPGTGRVSAVAARSVNPSAKETTTTVRAEAQAPLRVDGTARDLTVPAGEARDLYLPVTAPVTTPPGDYRVTVFFGGQSVHVPVTVPEKCHYAPAFATSWHVGNEPEKAVDGNPGTFWHTEWSPPVALPQSITVHLDGVRKISSLEYLPRQDGSPNGDILDYTIEVSTDGITFTEVAKGTWAANKAAKTATFAPVDAELVRLISTRSGGGPYASAAEITAR